ncbi:hypothetical protein BGX38DRAFT_1271947 [Terfezia claveryi]|nr:hypothetical protein BGX38DRAFT_1271947 [Terfezia claveryi]
MTAADTPSGGGMVPGSPPSKQNLISWWKQFSKKGAKPSDKEGLSKEKPGIFGVPLWQSIEYANVAISLTDANGNSFIYGYVPIVVAKCGVFLKEKATDVEGIFRLSGSAKRIKDLQNIFNTPEKYGKGLDWTGYTVHDAAAVLRRYLNQLPEPIIPLEYYDKFRAPLSLPPADAIRVYKRLIVDLPPLNRQLLLYILDLLAVFASKSEQNLMTSQNLSAIFQPGLISHPSHDMSPEDYRISQDVLVFLIENQDHFLMGMRGTSDDEESLLTPSTPSMHRKSASGVSRTPSNASAGAETLKNQGGIRRNVSVSSKKSVPGSPKVGVARSNTLPSRRSPGPRPAILKSTDKSQVSNTTLEGLSTRTGAPPSVGHMTENVSPSTPTATKKASMRSMVSEQSKRATPRSSDNRLEIPETMLYSDSSSSTPATTPSRDRNVVNLLSLSPSDTERGKQQNRLRKRRIPGSTNPSAESSTTSLPNSTHTAPHPTPETILELVPQAPAAAQLPRKSSSHSHINFVPQVPPSAINIANKKKEEPTPNSSGSGLAAVSPSNSATSSLSSRSGPESKEDKEPGAEKPGKRRSRWRMSVGKIETPPLSPPLGPTHKPSPYSNGNISHHSFGSPPPPSRREASRERDMERRELSSSDGGEDHKGAKGAIQWLQKKMSDRKHHHEKEHGDHKGRNDSSELLSQQASPPRTPHFGAVSQIQAPPPSFQLAPRRGDGRDGDSEGIGQAR